MKTPHPANGRPRKLGFQKMKLSWTGLTQRLRCGKGKGPCSKGSKTSSKSTGWTLQAVFIAVGVILSVIALAVKKGTKVVSQKLNNVKHEPGFIGSIVSFIFKAASQVFAFLSEHTWVIILVVVAFFMEKMLKKRRR